MSEATHIHSPEETCAQCGLNASGYAGNKDELDPLERRCVDNIEKHDCHIFNVEGPASEEPYDEGFAYSVGVFKKLRKPDLIVFGQKAQWQAGLINTVVEQMRAGRDFKAGGEYDGILENFLLAFRDVPRPAILHYMGWSCWYYSRIVNEPSFAALQVVWPDLQGRFPWHASYDNPYPQPVLDSYDWEWSGEDAIARPKS